MDVKPGGPLLNLRRSIARRLNSAVRRGRALHAGMLERAGDLSLRYIVCAEPDAWERVLAGHLAKLPTTRGQPLLVENEVLAFQRTLRPTGKWGRELGHRSHARMYRSLEEYKANHPGAADLQRYEGGYPSYLVRRVPEADEVVRMAVEDTAVRRLIELEMDPREVLLAMVTLQQYCNADPGDLPEYWENYILRPIAGAFLLVTNLSSRPADLQDLEVSTQARVTGKLRPLATAYEGTCEAVPLSAPPLDPQESMLIPMGTLVRPFGKLSYVAYASARQEISRDEQVTRLWDLRRVLSDDPALGQQHQLIGPALFPVALHPRGAWGRGTVPVRPFDVGRLSLLDVDNHWGLEAGSCPHLFFVHGQTAALHYSGEVFTGSPGQRCQDEVTVPPDAGHLVLAELEDEVTEVVGVWLDGVQTSGHKVLRRGDRITVAVRPGQRVRLVGRYFVGSGETDRRLPEQEKRARVLRFMEAFSTDPVPPAPSELKN